MVCHPSLPIVFTGLDPTTVGSGAERDTGARAPRQAHSLIPSPWALQGVGRSRI